MHGARPGRQRTEVVERAFAARRVDTVSFEAANVHGMPVFWVLSGEASEAALKDLAQLTGGQGFDARKRSLYSVFKSTRAYQ